MTLLRFLIVMAAAGAPGPIHAQMDRPGPAGDYRGAKCPTQGPGCTSGGPADRVRIGPVRDGKARVDVSLQFDAGHTCELSGEATAQSKRLILDADGLDADQPCQLTIDFDTSDIRLADDAGACRNVYCGTRGQFDGVHLKAIEKSRH